MNVKPPLLLALWIASASAIAGPDIMPPGQPTPDNAWGCLQGYVFISGACYAYAALPDTQEAVVEYVGEFKATGNIPKRRPKELPQDRCEAAKFKLARYKKNGVFGLDFQTGNLAKADAEATKDALERAQYDIDSHCEGQ